MTTLYLTVLLVTGCYGLVNDSFLAGIWKIRLREQSFGSYYDLHSTEAKDSAFYFGTTDAIITHIYTIPIHVISPIRYVLYTRCVV